MRNQGFFSASWRGIERQGRLGSRGKVVDADGNRCALGVVLPEAKRTSDVFYSKDVSEVSTDLMWEIAWAHDLPSGRPTMRRFQARMRAIARRWGLRVPRVARRRA